MSYHDSRRAHRDEPHRGRSAEALTWFQATPMTWLRLIGVVLTERDRQVILVGDGASDLVDEPLSAGFDRLTVLDVSGQTLGLRRKRPGSQAKRSSWIEADTRQVELPSSCAHWHDRAVSHLLTKEAERRAHGSRLERFLEPGGWRIIAAFPLDGLEQGSDLPVQRYDDVAPSNSLDSSFRLDAHVPEVHTTPAGTTQSFTYFRFRRET